MRLAVPFAAFFGDGATVGVTLFTQLGVGFGAAFALEIAQKLDRIAAAFAPSAVVSIFIRPDDKAIGSAALRTGPGVLGRGLRG